MAGATEAADYLNKTFEQAVNDGKSSREVETLMSQAMKEKEDFGTRDSEPLYHLELLLDAVFGKGRP